MSKAPTKHRIHIVLTAPQYERLRDEADRTGESVSSIVRRMIEAAHRKAR